MKKSILFSLSWLIVLAFIFTSCEKTDETPTKKRMEGVWQVVEAYDSSGTDIMSKIQGVIPITVVYLTSDNTLLSTFGPLTTYLVYGDTKWTEISSKIDQVFNYANLSFNGGEYFIADGVVDRFTVEMKLEGIGGTSTLVEILNIFNIQAEWLKSVVYHKFLDVKVSFNPTGDKMTWTFDNTTFARYNMKDQYGDYVLWMGFPTNKFSKSKFVLQKRSKTLQDLVQEAYQPPTF